MKIRFKKIYFVKSDFTKNQELFCGRKNRGQILVPVLVFGFVGLMFISAIAGWGSINLKALRYSNNRELALQIAESGVEYYRWHLAHDPKDFMDGTGVAGPYVHDYLDKTGVKIGEFSLNIIPPSVGSTIVTIKSTGTTSSEPIISRTIQVKLAIASWAKYAVVANDVMRFGEGTEVFGPITSNKGIRFDGVAHNIISSAVATYNDPDHWGANEFGVHTHVSPVDPLPPATVPNRPDVFMAGREFPIPEVDFNGITADLANLKAKAQTDGHYIAPSGKFGYHIILKNNNTFDLYKVTKLEGVPRFCGVWWQDDWGSWSIKKQSFINNYPVPGNGIIFVSDDVWVDGIINHSRVTIAAGYFPDSLSKRKSITVNNDLQYTNYDGSDSIALIAQKNINIGMISEDDLRIDAALIAQNGRVGRYYYGYNCSPYNVRSVVNLYGMIGTSGRYGFAYTNGTGYQIRNLYYDANLLYAPPPEFPLTTDQYSVISWEEI